MARPRGGGAPLPVCGLEAARSRHGRRVAAAHWSAARTDARGAWLVDSRQGFVDVFVRMVLSAVGSRSLGSCESCVPTTPAPRAIEQVPEESATLHCSQSSVWTTCRRSRRSPTGMMPARELALLPAESLSPPGGDRCDPGQPGGGERGQGRWRRATAVGSSQCGRLGGGRSVGTDGAAAGAAGTLRPILLVLWHQGRSRVDAPTCSWRLRSGADKAMHRLDVFPALDPFPTLPLIRTLLRPRPPATS